MASLKCLVILMLALLSVVSCVPIPGGLGHGEHTHFIIHVPHHVHTVHHTHVKKVHVPVPIVIDNHHHHHGWEHIETGGHGGWW